MTTTIGGSGIEWLESTFTIRPLLHRFGEWRAVCGLVWDIWGIALAVESTAHPGQNWSVIHLPTGEGVGSFDHRHLAMAYAERLAALGSWDAVGLAPVAERAALTEQARAIRAELGGR